MNKKILYLLVVVIFIGVIIVVFACFNKNKTEAPEWKKYQSARYNIELVHHPEWSVINDAASASAPMFLCPSAERIITTRYMYANCLQFFSESQLLQPLNEMEGDEPLFRHLSDVIREDFSGRSDSMYAIKYSSPAEEEAKQLFGVFKSQAITIGVWQPLCANTYKDEDCANNFSKIVGSIKFHKNN